METTLMLLSLFDPVEPIETWQLDQPSGAFQPAQTSRPAWMIRTTWTKWFRCVGGICYLSEKVMSFAKVAKSDVAVQTQCSNCFDSIKSRWTWKHPGPGKLHTLVPQTGHGIVADSRVKRKCPWLVVGDFPPINDNVAEQGFCAHGRQIENCRLCGGRHICPRSRRRCQCSICKVQSSGPQSVTAAKTVYSTMPSRARKQQRQEPQNMLESVPGLPAQVSGALRSGWRRYERLWSLWGRFTMFTQKIGPAGEYGC